MTRSLVLGTLLALASALPADAQIVVPLDAPDLQTAVQLAQPGDRIFVRTLVPQAPVFVDKPITIVGQPRARIEIPCGQHAGVLLAGPGGGRVTLSHVDIVLASECAFPDAGIAGDGFRELFLDDCTVDTRWTAFAGVTYGTPAIAANLSLITLQNTQIYGGSVDADVCIGPLPGGGHPGILAPFADVVALHSTVEGGDGGYLCCEFCSCPGGTSAWGGQGGVGAIVSNVYLIESDFRGGAGSELVAYPGFESGGGGFPCTTQDVGQPLDVVAGHLLAASLSGTGPLTVGRRWALEWAATSDVSWVFGSSRHVTPWALGGSGSGAQGFVFLALDSLFLQALVPIDNGQGRFELAVPPVLDLVGASVGFQILDPGAGLSSPVLRIVGI